MRIEPPNQGKIRMPTDDEIARAIRALRAGALVAFPTETVYGLGGDATNPRAVAAIFDAKGRPQFNPLISHVTDFAAARRLGIFNASAEALAKAFWPGPLTLVVKRQPNCPVCDLATAGLDSIAIRVPAHPLAQALLQGAAIPIAAPSANRSGHVSPTTAAHVREDLGDRVATILDGGECHIGLESTIIDARNAGSNNASGNLTILRPGGLSLEAIEDATGLTVAMAEVAEEPDAPQSPGLLSSHYAPRAALRLNATHVNRDEALLAFGPPLLGQYGPIINLSPKGDVVEAAAALYAALRNLDDKLPDHLANIAVMPIPEEGLGRAINDRLRRAAAPRPNSAPPHDE